MDINVLCQDEATFSDKAFNFVVEGIFEDKFKPGEKVGEREIARALNISQIPVREAFEKLVQKGWIEKFPQRGAFVKKFDTQEIRKLSQVREVFELGAVRIIVEQINDSQLNELEVILAQLNEACEKSDENMYEQADINFHYLLVKFAGNEMLSSLYEDVLRQSHGFFLSAAAKTAFSLKKKLESIDLTSHEKIYKALKDRNRKMAEKEVARHLRSGCEFAIKVAKIQNILV